MGYRKANVEHSGGEKSNHLDPLPYVHMRTGTLDRRTLLTHGGAEGAWPSSGH